MTQQSATSIAKQTTKKHKMSSSTLHSISTTYLTADNTSINYVIDIFRDQTTFKKIDLSEQIILQTDLFNI